MTDSTPFSATTDDTVTPPANTTTLPPEVSELVGQGKKYATVDDALKSVPHAQNHIKTLTEELQAAKAELEKRKTAEQLLEEIKSGIKPTEIPSTSPITPDIVAQLIKQTLSEQQQETVAAKNVEQVTTTFSAKYGDKAEEVYIELAKQTGLTVQQLNLLSKTSPAAVLKLAGLSDSKPPVAGKLDSSVNTENFQRQQDTSTLSAKVRSGASTKDLVNSWKIAGQKVGKPS
jgi:hypothetical protein